MTKKFNSFISLVLVLLILSPILAEASSNIGTSAWGAIAIDADTGEVLYSKNPDKSLVPASLTKIMTTYIIYEEIEAGRLTKNTRIPVSKRVANISRDKSYPMSVPLKSGSGYSVDQFIKLIMIPSASASCIAVAEHISGSEANFVKRMNATAKRMGIQANFKNSHGARPHYTTARAMATLVKNFIEDYPDILNYTSMQGINFNGRRYNILNKLMHSKRYQGVDGFKTGTIGAARYCLASTGKKDNRRVIAIVLGSANDNARYSDSKKILDLAFSKIKSQDRSRNNTSLSISNSPKEVRRNTEYSPKINFKNVASPYRQTGRFYVDNKLVKEFKNKTIKNGQSFNLPFVYNKANIDKEFIELKYVMDRPKKAPKTIVKKIRLSQREPALYKDTGFLSRETELKLRSLRDQNLINGIGNGYFGATSKINRADFMTLLGRMVELKGLDKIENKPSVYKDVKTKSYYNKYVVWATEKNLVGGFNNRFNPRGYLSLEEMAKIVDNFFRLYDIELEETKTDGKIDRKNLSDWARPYVENLAKTDILYKENSNTIYPKERPRRIDIVNVIWNMVDKLDGDDQGSRESVYKDTYGLEEDLEERLVKLKEEELLMGIGNGYFSPYSVSKRADFITLLGRFVEKKGLDVIENKDSLYQDVKKADYYNKYVVWATEKGLVEGYKNKFNPHRTLNVEEAAKILCKLFESYGLDFKEISGEAKIDRENLSSWAEVYVEKIARTNILYRRGSDTIYPKDNLRRIDLVDLIWNILESYEALDQDEDPLEDIILEDEEVLDEGENLDQEEVEEVEEPLEEGTEDGLLEESQEEELEKEENLDQEDLEEETDPKAA